MRKFLKITRGLLVGLLIIVVGLPTTFYVMLSTDWAHERLRDFGERELQNLLGTSVSIGSVDFHPFNRLEAHDITVRDDRDSVALAVSDLEARIEAGDFLMRRKLIVDYVTLEGLDGRIYRDSASAPLNIAGIIDRLRGDGTPKNPSAINLRVSSLIISDARLRYDVLSDSVTPGRFNPSHIAVDSLYAVVFAPQIANNSFRVRIDHLQLREHSGLRITDLTTSAFICPDSLSVTGTLLKMPRTCVNIADIAMPLDSLRQLPLLGREVPVSVGVAGNVYLPDLAAFVPQLSRLPYDLDLDVSVDGSAAGTASTVFSIAQRGSITAIEGSATVSGAIRPAELTVDASSFTAEANGYTIAHALQLFVPRLSPKVSAMIAGAGRTVVDGSITGRADDLSADLTLHCGHGAIDITADAKRGRGDSYNISATADMLDVDLGTITGNRALGMLSGVVTTNGVLRGKNFEGSADADISELEFRGYTYRDITAEATADGGNIALSLACDDPNMMFTADASDIVADGEHRFSATAIVDRADLHAVNLWRDYPGHALSTKLTLDGNGKSASSFAAKLAVTRLYYLDSIGDGLKIKYFNIDADNTGEFDHITVDSDIFSGSLDGRYDLTRLVPDIKAIAAKSLAGFPMVDRLSPVPPQPAFMKTAPAGVPNDFAFDFSITDAEAASRFLRLPVAIIYPIQLSGTVSEPAKQATVSIDAPWLMQGDKIIDNTTATVALVGSRELTFAYFTTHMPTKKGPMNIIASMRGTQSQVFTNIDWSIERDKPLQGTIGFDTELSSCDGRELDATVMFRKSRINFGNDVWTIAPSVIDWHDKRLTVKDFAMTAGEQRIFIDGSASTADTDSLTVDLQNIHLIDIFETLDINNALIGGVATGRVTATSLFSPIPDISTDNLHVRDIGYNYCTLGDADVSAFFDVDKKAFTLDADVVEPGGRHSHIFGDIYAATESLDITFEANRVKVGFMKPFMKAFADDLKGYASGRARLFGTFKYIDLEGDVFADSLQIKINFTNTWYSATDSLHMSPGLIKLDDITIRDINGHTAKLNGEVRHKFFMEPSFNFSITDARDFLSYDVTPKLSPDWYGRIYGNGSAHVSGEPGVVNIGVRMSTAENSTFTFVLSDAQVADEYSFITFRDVTPVTVADSIAAAFDTTPQAVKDYLARINARQDERPTAYNMDIQVDITPQAEMIIVMDPIGGDRIRGRGQGNMRMTYESVSNDLRMYGTYTLDKGSYNFTLQDIIIKDFTIREGSSIRFNGDPYSADLDITAHYTVNGASLSDLDESFLQDKELNNTNVRVNALMHITGDMRQPDISFDLEFPSLTQSQDVYRKVKSIISTEDMMNRQIIYLLALNRFYTPDYMASTTKGNELFSVASSTIASQLSSMLGKLSDNWSIAPNLRSDHGDFSDVEVDVMLSSTLLNNRLLFNGNFGYRDKSLNTNQFIGDFNIEYLLTPRGTWRLKAYNRYNDQNYYLRTAQTTQGVGIMYRRDFDNIFSFLRRKKKVAEPETVVEHKSPADTIPDETSND